MIYTNVGSGGAVCGGWGNVPDPIVVIDSIDQVDLTTFLVRFHSTRVPPVTFSVYVAGEIQDQPFSSSTGTGQVFINVGADQSPYFEITDFGAPHYAASGVITLNFRRVAGAVQYQIQQASGASWITLGTVPESGKGNTVFETPWLPDDETSSFRVVPVDLGGATATPLPYSVFMVRHPDVPNAAYSCASGQLTISIS